MSDAAGARNSGRNADRLIPGIRGGRSIFGPADVHWIDPVPELTRAERERAAAQRAADKTATDAGDPIDMGEAAVAIREREAAANAFYMFLMDNLDVFDQAAVEIVAPVAPTAPPAIKREAAARVYGWLRDVSPSRTETQASNPEDAYRGAITLASERATYRPAMQGALRGSGALALLAPWIERRAV